MVYVLGISAFFHDSASALVHDGEIIAAAQEERFTRKKHDPSYPRQAIDYVLRQADITLDDVEYVAFYDKPFLKFERLLQTYTANAPRGFRSFNIAIPLWLREKLFQKSLLSKELDAHIKNSFDHNKLLFAEHHFSHAASAFFPSPFEEALILTLDGVGEWATTTVAVGNGNNIEILKEIHFPHSLGLLYSAFTYYVGFRVNSGEYKVMGLAPYGKPRFKKIILEKLVDVKPDGSFRLDMKYFDYDAGLTMVSRNFIDLFGEPVRIPETDCLTQFHMDIAASIQSATEEILLNLVSAQLRTYKIPNLCLAGGVALNCVANGMLYRAGVAKDIWIQPAAGDAGGAIGAALAAWHSELKKERKINTQKDGMKGAFLGPSFSQSEVENSLMQCGGVFETLTERQMIIETAQALAEGKAIGWFQGRMEFGPRSLGCRSILGDPRSEQMQKTLNIKIKFRESFRPFAPSILREEVAEWFDIEYDSPYMLLVTEVTPKLRRKMTDEEQALFGVEKLNVKRSIIPAVTHVDYSARLQTVHKETNPIFYELISEFKRITGCPVLLNTSFNIRGEPIVCSVQDAFRCFMGTGIDLLVCGNSILEKSVQNDVLIEDYRHNFPLD